MSLITEMPNGTPTTNALDDIPDDLLSVPPAYLSFGQSPATLEDPPEIGDSKTYVVRVKCVGQSCSERQDGELRYGRKLTILGCHESGKQPPSDDGDQPGLFDAAGNITDDEGHDDGLDEFDPAFSHNGDGED